jgi:hypothetical protein
VELLIKYNHKQVCEFKGGQVIFEDWSYISTPFIMLMKNSNDHSEKICPVTGLNITIVLPQDGFYAASYTIDDLNPHCLIRISAQVLINKEIMSLLKRFKKQFGKNLSVNDAEEIIITTENYLAFVAQFSKN